MALSNIFREPRREITETLIGIALALAPPLFMQTTSPMYNSYPGDMPDWLGLLIWMPISWFAAAVISLVLITIHALGEGLCNRLQEVGIHLRPRVRH